MSGRFPWMCVCFFLGETDEQQSSVGLVNGVDELAANAAIASSVSRLGIGFVLQRCGLVFVLFSCGNCHRKWLCEFWG